MNVHLKTLVLTLLISSATSNAQEASLPSIEQKFTDAIDLLASSAPSESIKEAAIRFRISHDNTEVARKSFKEAGYSFLPGDAELKYANAKEHEESQIDALVTAVSSSAANELPVKYSSPAFQCLSDYDTCIADNNLVATCGVYLAICLAERIVPLAGD